jgi:isopentenyldiphosphate isomerase
VNGDPSATPEDLLQLVDEEDRDAGTAARGRVHREGLRHRSVHVAVSDGHGRLLLQKRSSAKDTAPGKWDISVGGHLDPGESYLEAARRECGEEIGLEGDLALERLGRRERVETFAIQASGPFRANPGEVDELRFLEIAEVEDLIERGLATRSLAQEWREKLRHRIAAER